MSPILRSRALLRGFGLRRPKEYMVADQRFPVRSFRRADVRFGAPRRGYDLRRPGRCRPGGDAFDDRCRFRGQADRPFPEDDPLPGYRMLVRGDIMRGRYRRSFSRPEAFTPGVPARVPFRMTDIAHTFRAGTPHHGAGTKAPGSRLPNAIPSSSSTSGTAGFDFVPLPDFAAAPARQCLVGLGVAAGGALRRAGWRRPFVPVFVRSFCLSAILLLTIRARSSV